TKSQINKIITAVMLLFFSLTMNSQDLTDNLKIWSGVSVSYNLNENLKAKFSQLLALNVSPVNYSFSQTKLALSYKIKRRMYLEGGYVRGLFNESNSLKDQGATSGLFNTLAVDRIYGNYSFKHDIVKRLSLKHKIEFQYYIPDLDKYKTRSIYSARMGYNVRKSSLSPYLEGQFYYYSGGVISSGIKRFRLKPGFSFKPFKESSMRISFYYIFNNEFNTDPLTDNDYSVIGTNLSFKIN
ncbi:DUF2490 domain-containing protein, partial [Olleya sp. AH-315-F22]|nr:DUF2490 domain-containing protein [Olleya sp. AH-315-F22]